MIYAVRIGGVAEIGKTAIGGKIFYLDEGSTFTDVISYCESVYKFKGEYWNLVKESGDWEELEEFLEISRVKYDDYDDE